MPVEHVAKAVNRGKVDAGCVPVGRLEQAVEDDLLDLDDLPEEVREELRGEEESSGASEEEDQETEQTEL